MSTRRAIGDKVWLSANAGFVSRSNDRQCVIPDVPENRLPWETCMLDCGDDDCREWVTVYTVPDPENGGEQYPLYHVSECQMHDTQQTEAGT